MLDVIWISKVSECSYWLYADTLSAHHKLKKLHHLTFNKTHFILKIISGDELMMLVKMLSIESEKNQEESEK